ncbi:MAG: deoxyribose-phosphate aldolase [Flavisolibacter sp.]
MSIAGYIDHSLLKNNIQAHEIDQLCQEAKQYCFASICIPPYYVKAARKILGLAIPIATVIGFPMGYSVFKSKLIEMQVALKDGARELDMVMNMAAFKNKDLTYLEKEIKTLSGFTTKNNLVLKVIIETGLLTEEEIIACCNFYQHFPIQYLKTSTGFSGQGATIGEVKLIRQHLSPSIGIKASGGIKTYAFAKELIEAGASRLGCSASVAIVNESLK